MNKDLKLKDRNIENTEPYLLKELTNENFERRVSKFRKTSKFFIINYIFFAVISIMFYINPIFLDISKYSTTIAIASFLLSIVFEVFLNKELLSQKVSNAILDSYIDDLNKKPL